MATNIQICNVFEKLREFYIFQRSEKSLGVVKNGPRFLNEQIIEFFTFQASLQKLMNNFQNLSRLPQF